MDSKKVAGNISLRHGIVCAHQKEIQFADCVHGPPVKFHLAHTARMTAVWQNRSSSE
jgi:hypothetical protein